jgi:hypothetical protein
MVVERRDTGLVQKELNRLGVTAHELASSQALQLTLLELPNLESEAPALLPHLPPELSASRAQPAPGQTAESDSYLDLVLTRVRWSMQQRYDNWAPTMGKDQVLDRIQGTPYIKGATGIPEPLDAPLSIPPASRTAGPRVAILDTELYAHPALAGRYQGPSAETFGPAPPSDTQAHSTFIAGLIVQRAPTAELVVRTVLNKDGKNASSWDVATKMVSVLDSGVAVLNLSLSCATLDREPPPSLRRAVERLIPTVVVVAAAGNNGVLGTQATAEGLHPNTPIYPAAIDGVVGVGAYDPSDPSHKPASFNPPPVPWVELLAPGVGVRSTFLSGPVVRMYRDPSGQLVQLTTDHGPVDFGQPGYASWDGTSFAAANVSGAIAALMARHHLSGYEALNRLRNPATKGSDIFPAGPA